MSISKVSGETIIATFGGGYALQGSLSTAAFSPIRDLSYYGGDASTQKQSLTAQTRRVYIPKTGTIKFCYGFFNQVAQPISSLGALEINVNNGTYTLISQANHFSTTTLYSNTSLSIAVTQGDYIEFRWTCPTSAPKGVICEFVVYIE